MSTPACSGYIRDLVEKKLPCIGAMILTASHNPGGPNEDFGIKFNSETGSAVLEAFTNALYKRTLEISEYKIADDFTDKIDITKNGSSYIFSNIETPKKNFIVRIVSTTDLYVKNMQKIFNFDEIKRLLERKDFKMIMDGLHGVVGPQAVEIFHKILGVPIENLMNCVPKEDFGGGHPDPNLVYAHNLVEEMDIHNKQPGKKVADLGVACDGDADRNMILGPRFFVTPSDSLALITAYFKDIFKGVPLTGVARSMPTSGAVDQVAKSLNIPLYEVPTGWKFFGNLMDAGKICICGEESFGTGSDYIREKDGMWAILCWLSILAFANKNSEKLVGIPEIMQKHWKQYGRNYCLRYDYENVTSEQGNQVMENMIKQWPEFTNMKEGNVADVFNYTDPVDGSVSKNQGIRMMYKDGSRFILRLSGTGSVGATIRVYFEKYEKEKTDIDREVALEPIIKDFLKLANMEEITGRKEPSVIT